MTPTRHPATRFVADRDKDGQFFGHPDLHPDPGCRPRFPSWTRNLASLAPRRSGPGVVAIALGVSYLTGPAWGNEAGKGPDVERSSHGPPIAARPALTPSEATAVGAFTAGWFREKTPAATGLPDAFRRTRAVVYVAARAQGDRLAHVWRQEATGPEALRQAAAALRAELSPADQARVTTLEINLAHSFSPVDPDRERARLSNVHRGLLGLELIQDGRAYRFAPTEMIAFNLSFDRALERLSERARLAERVPGDSRATVRLFAADQLLVNLSSDPPRTSLLYRGNTVTPIQAITRSKARQVAKAQTQWLFSNLQPDGRQVYLYWPSRGEESTNRNQIRLWLATVAMGRAAQKDPALQTRAEQNLRYNLAHSYVEDPMGHGLIMEDGQTVKLGALAVAGLALLEHPDRRAFTSQLAALNRAIQALWQPNGEFRTFWQPTNRTDNVNFYPGEALLFWASLHAESRDPALLERILTSQRFYRTWHLAQRNPAFVPWHTQACFKVWEITRSDDLRDWIFAMNDWLLEIQQWDSQREFPDTMGRFYDPDRPFGPPHASSTGVYLEGLIDAWRLARATGDTTRQENYRRTLIRGLRSLTQLTFLDDVDLFYVTRRDRVYGGVRTTVYDNAIRVDNVQHSLMALLKILDHLPADDFRP